MTFHDPVAFRGVEVALSRPFCPESSSNLFPCIDFSYVRGMGRTCVCETKMVSLQRG